MSQVKFKTEHKGAPVEVMGGWDRPLRHFHLAIFDKDDEPVWTTMFEYPGGGTSDSEALLTKLEELGIKAPEGFADRFRREEANVMYTHRNGEWDRREW